MVACPTGLMTKQCPNLVVANRSLHKTPPSPISFSYHVHFQSSSASLSHPPYCCFSTRLIPSLTSKHQWMEERGGKMVHCLSNTLGGIVATLVTIIPLISMPPVAMAQRESISSVEIRAQAVEITRAEDTYFETVPQGLSSSDDDSGTKKPRLGSLLEGPKGSAVQQCTRKCVPTCIRGGQGAPGLGPISVRKEIVVFKEGYRSRSYCLSECIQVCSLTLNPPKKSP